MTVAIDAQDLFRVHSTPEGDAAALQGLTLSVAEGEILTVLGPSGAGKTTLLRILAGLDRPSAGTCASSARTCARSAAAAARATAPRASATSTSTTSSALAPELTARELVGLRLRAEGRDWAPRADELLRRVGLGEKPAPGPRALGRRAAAGRALRRARAPAAAAARGRADGRARRGERAASSTTRSGSWRPPRAAPS